MTDRDRRSSRRSEPSADQGDYGAKSSTLLFIGWTIEEVLMLSVGIHFPLVFVDALVVIPMMAVMIIRVIIASVY